MTDDLTFITNEKDKNLLDRFVTLIKDTQFFDCLVGYFYTSGFNSIYKSLERAEKIRILIGISTNQKTFELIQESKKDLYLSHKEVKEVFTCDVIKEMEDSPDSIDVENGVQKFIEWLRSGKLEIRVYPEQNIHAKLYIMTFKKGDRDVGRIITGSSNFTRAGLKENIEFNVELKNRSDYEFAIQKFNELWGNSIDVSEKYVETIRNKTWLNDSITPYELFLKFLYEYLKEKINIDKDELSKAYAPENFMDLEYQKDAVRDAKVKLEEYGGVFIADVVGLGKTYISAMLANQLDGRNLVIAPPILLDKDNPGSWPCVFSDFGVRQTDFESIGMLDKIIKRGVEKYKNIFIDEAHRFRTEATQMYENLFKICRGKRVILISATPLNNTPMDILSQIKLFQNSHKSTLPSPKVRDLEKYFKSIQNRLKDLDRQENREEYFRIVKENAKDIRENILKYLMVRRTRSSIVKYYSKDLQTQKLKFPEVNDPKPILYHFDKELDKIFNETVELIAKKFKYARYTPLLYLKKGASQPEEISQKNMRKFMKVLLLKRLESSFFAFKQSIDRFIHSYKNFIEEYKNGNVYVSKKYVNKIFELLEDNDTEAIEELIKGGKAYKYSSKEFDSEFINYLRNDLEILEKIQKMWSVVKKDPKLDRFIELLSKDKILKKNKLLVFTESKETATYLEEKLNPKLGNKVLAYYSDAGDVIKRKVMDNFDPRSRHPKDDYRVLISTEVLSEGVNLHRSNVVINYDIPWNPTRMMQRVGRINRVDCRFNEIYTYNFFPAGPINKNISLKEAAEAKIEAFIEMLGNDARLLTNEEIKSHDLFNRLVSKKTLTGEDEEDDPELKYLTYLRNIRDNNKDLFEKIKMLPKKARTSKKYKESFNSVITFFRKGKLRKIYKTNGKVVEEVDFDKASEILEAQENTKKEKIDAEFYKHLEANKMEFDKVFLEEEILQSYRGRSIEAKLVKIIKAIEKAKFTEIEEDYLKEVLTLLKDGAIPRITIKKILKEIKNETDPSKIFSKIKLGISSEIFQKTIITSAADINGPKEVILSEYLVNGN
jgi:superfamily II DNA or RNA helicase